jgi:hypothetical protein
MVKRMRATTEGMEREKNPRVDAIRTCFKKVARNGKRQRI